MDAAHLHPLTGVAVVIFLFYTGSLGLRARTGGRQRAPLLARHAALGPWLLGCMLVTWTGGVASTWLWRPDLPPGGSVHMRLGVALLALMAGAWATSRRMDLPLVRRAHPWFGAAAMLLGAAQAFFGLQITR